MSPTSSEVKIVWNADEIMGTKWLWKLCSSRIECAEPYGRLIETVRQVLKLIFAIDLH